MLEVVFKAEFGLKSCLPFMAAKSCELWAVCQMNWKLGPHAGHMMHLKFPRVFFMSNVYCSVFSEPGSMVLISIFKVNFPICIVS